MVQVLKRIRAIMLSDLRLKALAIAMALAIWFYGSSQLKEEIVVHVPLTIAVPGDFRVVYPNEAKLRLRIKGPRELVERLAGERAELRMTERLTGENVPVGLTRLRVKRGWLNLPESELVQMSIASDPPLVDVYAYPLVKRTLPVEVELEGQPYPGYFLRKVKTIPSKVEVRGPAPLLERMTAVRTKGKVSVLDLRESMKRGPVELATEEVFPLAENVAPAVPLELSTTQVYVEIDVSGEMEERKLERIPVQTLLPIGFPYKVEIRPEEATVSVIASGLREELEKISPEAVSAYVDLRDLSAERIDPGGSGLYKEEVRLVVAPGVPVSVGRPQPEKITVVLRNPAK